MANRVRWHTAPTRPAYKAKDQENVPAGVLALDPQFAEKLDALERLLQKHGNPTSTPLGQADDFQLWAEYEREYPGQLTPKMQTPRYSYFLMAQLATAADVKAWLEEWRHAGLDLGPFTKTSFFASPNLAQQTSGLHTHLDETLPNGTVRHLHDTQVAANSDLTGAAQIVLGDPYLGTGLDPAHLSGVVAPYRSTLKPYMACCGQKLDAPGCWIQMDPRLPSGQLVPYTLWFSGNDEADILDTWQSAIENRLVDRIRSAVQTGTAFIKEEYYANLDRQIRALLAAPGLVNAIQTVHANVFNANFVGDGPWARLSETYREELRMLVALVDRYNAPQWGACHRQMKRSDPELEALIFRPLEGKSLALQGLLVRDVRLRGEMVSLLSATNFAELIARLVDRLEEIGFKDSPEALANVQRLMIQDTENQVNLERNVKLAETNFSELDKAALRIQFPELLQSFATQKQDLLNASIDLRNQLSDLLNTITQVTNTWMQGEPEDDLGDALDGIRGLEAFANDQLITLENTQEFNRHADVLLTWLLTLPKTTDELRAALPDESKPYVDNPEVRKLAYILLLWPNLSERLKTRLQPLRNQLEENAGRFVKEATEAVRRRSFEEFEEYRPPRAEEEERIQKRQVFQLPTDEQNKAGILQELVAIPEKGPIVRGVNFKYDSNSCPYDSFYAALFKVPNQWFRNVIRKAQQVEIPEKRIESGKRACQAVDALRLHNTLIEGIDFVEIGRGEPQVCPLPTVWDSCMRTRRPGGGIEDDPLELLNALVNFYQVADRVQFVPILNWEDVFVAEGKEMIVVQMQNPLNLPENVAYELPLALRNNDDSYTMISAFFYSNEERAQHFDCAVRDPRTGNWKLYRTSGIPQEPQNPGMPDEIRKRTTYFGGTFYPTAWIYVRTERLQQFRIAEADNIITIDRPIQEAELADVNNPKRNAFFAMFGGIVDDLDNWKPMTKEFTETRGITIVVGLYWMLRFYENSYSKVNSLFFKDNDAFAKAFPDYANTNPPNSFYEFLQEFAIPLIFEPLMLEGWLSSNVKVAPSIMTKLRELARLVFMTVDDAGHVPRLRPTQNHFHVQNLGQNEKEKEEVAISLFFAWAEVLLWLSLQLLPPTDETRTTLVFLEKSITEFGENLQNFIRVMK